MSSYQVTQFKDIDAGLIGTATAQNNDDVKKQQDMESQPINSAPPTTVKTTVKTPESSKQQRIMNIYHQFKQNRNLYVATINMEKLLTGFSAIHSDVRAPSDIIQCITVFLNGEIGNDIQLMMIYNAKTSSRLIYLTEIVQYFDDVNGTRKTFYQIMKQNYNMSIGAALKIHEYISKATKSKNIDDRDIKGYYVWRSNKRSVEGA